MATGTLLLLHRLCSRYQQQQIPPSKLHKKLVGHLRLALGTLPPLHRPCLLLPRLLRGLLPLAASGPLLLLLLLLPLLLLYRPCSRFQVYDRMPGSL